MRSVRRVHRSVEPHGPSHPAAVWFAECGKEARELVTIVDRWGWCALAGAIVLVALAGAIVLVALALGTAPAASARTVPLGWVERHSAYGRHFVMTFTVTSLTIDRRGWSARISSRNQTNLLTRHSLRW
jgi:hypothetical protein